MGRSVLGGVGGFNRVVSTSYNFVMAVGTSILWGRISLFHLAAVSKSINGINPRNPFIKLT